MSRKSHNPPPVRPSVTAKPSVDPTEASRRPPAQPPVPTSDPPDLRIQLWGLRLWILAALGIVAFALANYLLNWILR
jgi:hypothetical protein